MHQMKSALSVARCAVVQDARFLVSWERAGDGWMAMWAQPIARDGSGYGPVTLEGVNFLPSATFACPHCGARSFVRCGCGQLGCWDGVTKVYRCAWCRTTGRIEGPITSLDTVRDF